MLQLTSWWVHTEHENQLTCSVLSSHPTLPNESHHVSSQVTSRRRLRFHANSENKKITSMCTNASEVTHLSVDSTLVELLEPQKHKDDLPVPWKSGHKSCDERCSIFFKSTKWKHCDVCWGNLACYPWQLIHSSLISH